MIASTAVLLRSQGIAGTSFPKVLEHARAPRGSIGHHFPGGKTELLREAIDLAGAEITRHLVTGAEAGADAATIVDGICDYFATWLTRTDYTAGCPVAAAAQEAYADPDLGVSARQAIEDWTLAVTATMPGRNDARALAQVCIAAVEGAVMMARVTRSTEPLDSVRAQLRLLLTNR
ncbi:TetR/AcrR family transcriptional regulator [Nocardioides cheoyonin]|uniref:TetR/AcrR family transcriptional regulator n=1 Tax=Nocardioides cheoyonin TaxID=3156615 RepID=UPI0032B36CDE